MRCLTVATVVMGLTGGPAFAELQKLDTLEEFVSAVSGKTLSRPLVSLQVGQDGQISGKGMRWAVEGSWSWQDGYFCRDLYWGGEALGYNCQEVRASGDRIRFTSDKGSGQSAEFRLN